MKIGLRVEASAEIGYGHWMRTIAVGEALKARGNDCVVVTRSDAQTSLPRRVPEDALSLDLLIADLHRPEESELLALKRTARRLVCIDDESTFVFDCTLLINPNLAFMHKIAPGTRYLSGGAYIPLRAQFRSPPPHPIRRRIERLLVCFGGSDPSGLTAIVVRELRDRPHARVAVVIGPAYGDENRLRTLIAGEGYTLHRDVADMRQLFTESDAGILGAGTLMYEAAATGLPALFMSANAAQEREAIAVEAAGGGVYLRNAEKLSQSLDALQRESRRHDLSARAQRLIDGCGVERIVEAILELGR